MIPDFHYAIELFFLVLLIILVHQCRKYKNLSEKDQFTAAFHKTWFENNLVNLMRKAKSSKTTLGIAMIDLDNFKKINDTKGHAYGDQVLLTVVKSINSALGKTSKLARYGGDEFIVIIPDATEESFPKIISEIQKTIRKTGLITASIGATVFHPDDKLNFSKLINKIDTAVYDAKKIRNCVVMADDFHKNDVKSTVNSDSTIREFGILRT